MSVEKKENNKVAYLIQAYSDYNALKKLVYCLLDMGNCHIFVHLDKKSDITKFLIKDSRVHFIDKREFVSWAGYNQGKLIMNLIEAALAYSERFEMYAFLSESDYPVYNGEELESRLRDVRTIVINCSQKQKQKIERYWFYDFGISSVRLNKVVSKLVNGIFGVLYKIRICKKKNKVKLDGKEVDVYCSGPFWRYDYEQIKYIYDKFTSNRELQKYFKHSFASCELIVSTIIANSKYVDKCQFVDEYQNLCQLSSLCFFKYTGPRVNVLTEDDYDDILQSQKPFIRKVKEGVSDTLINKIEDKWVWDN